MRKCVVLLVAALAVLSFSLVGQLSAQSVYLGAGATFPAGDYKDLDEAKTGWMVEGGFGFPLGESGFYGLVGGIYGSNDHEYEGESTDLLGGLAGVEYVVGGEGGVHPFFFGQVGFLRHKYNAEGYDDSSSGLAFGGGAGLSIPLGGVSGWALGRYLQAQTEDEEAGFVNTSFFGLMAGISVPLAGN
ncbi:MAG: outer membrane beta-barrel protein [Gemmatimonadota bacterium]|jgi:hypothetical protein